MYLFLCNYIHQNIFVWTCMIYMNDTCQNGVAAHIDSIPSCGWIHIGICLYIHCNVIAYIFTLACKCGATYTRHTPDWRSSLVQYIM